MSDDPQPQWSPWPRCAVCGESANAMYCRAGGGHVCPRHRGPEDTTGMTAGPTFGAGNAGAAQSCCGRCGELVTPAAYHVCKDIAQSLSTLSVSDPQRREAFRVEFTDAGPRVTLAPDLNLDDLRALPRGYVAAVIEMCRKALGEMTDEEIANMALRTANALKPDFVRALPLAYLYAVRELVATAIYDRERERR